MIRQICLFIVIVFGLAACKASEPEPASVKDGKVSVTKEKTGANKKSASNKKADTQQKDVQKPKKNTIAKPEAVLLGVSDKSGALRTVFVDEKGFTVLGSELAIPRNDGWAKLGVRHDVDSSGHNTFETAYVTTDKKYRPVKHVFDKDRIKRCESGTYRSIGFVGKDFATSSDGEWGACDGDAHPYSEGGMGTWRIEIATAAGVGKQVALQDVMGRPASKAFIKEGNAVITQSNAEHDNDDGCLGEPSVYQWGFVRFEGRWVVQGFLNAMAHYCQSRETEFNVLGIDVPAEITGTGAVSKPWDAIKSVYPTAIDAVESPSGNLLVVLTEEGMLLEIDGKKIAEHPAPKNKIVMTQWVDGKKIAAWKKDAMAILK